jgi:predicted O-methyltransferase YrrM
MSSKLITFLYIKFIPIFKKCYASLYSYFLPDKISLNEYLRCYGGNIYKEGFSAQFFEQESFIKNTIIENNFISIMEIGFHAGHSAEIILGCPKTKLISFDINQYYYTEIGERFIANKFKNKHRLIKGNSIITLPKFISENPKTTFDLIFIDGGHEYNIVKTDLKNCKKLAHKNTLIILDDTVFDKTPDYSIGPTKIWSELLDKGEIIELGRSAATDGRGFSWGKFSFH